MSKKESVPNRQYKDEFKAEALRLALGWHEADSLRRFQFADANFRAHKPLRGQRRTDLG